MTREQTEQFEQDRHGNVRRSLDEHRARDGNGGMDGENGIVSVAAGDSGTTQTVFVIPDDASQAILETITLYNNTANAATFHVEEATLNDDGSVDTSTRRSVTRTLAADDERDLEYTGRPFTEDAIAINVSEAAEVGVGVILDHYEEEEPAAVQTDAP